MERITLVAWIALTSLAVFAVLLIRYRRQKTINLELAQFISLTLAVLGVVSSCQLIYKAFTLQQLKSLLGADIVTLVIGAIAVIWVSAKEVWKLL